MQTQNPSSSVMGAKEVEVLRHPLATVHPLPVTELPLLGTGLREGAKEGAMEAKRVAATFSEICLGEAKREAEETAAVAPAMVHLPLPRVMERPALVAVTVLRRHR